MKPTNIVVLAVLAAFLVVMIAQLRAPERVEVTQLGPQGEFEEATQSSPQGRFDPASAALGTDSFQRQLVLSELTRRWANLGLPTDLPQAVVDGRLGSLTVQLDDAAEAGNHQANFVLAELDTFCEDVRASRDRDAEALIVAAQALPPEDTAHVRTAAGWVTWIDEQLFLQCRDAIFDSIAIAARIEAAASQGHAPSQWRHGLMETDPAQSYRDVLDAALAGFLAAELTLANYFGPNRLPLFAGQKVLGSRSFWLQQAAEQAPNAKALLGECYRLGCDAAAPAPTRAAEHFVDAARSGVRLAHRGLSELAEDEPQVVSRVRAYAWRSFSQRLNELGCYGLEYIRYFIEDSRELPVLRGRLGASRQKDAEQLADQIWTQYGEEARSALGCAAA